MKRLASAFEFGQQFPFSNTSALSRDFPYTAKLVRRAGLDDAFRSLDWPDRCLQPERRLVNFPSR